VPEGEVRLMTRSETKEWLTSRATRTPNIGRSSATATTEVIVGVPTELMVMGRFGALLLRHSELMVVKLKGDEKTPSPQAVTDLTRQ
jgi:hypothetical protein